MAGKFCKNCISWDGELFRRVNESFGLCEDPVAGSKIIADSVGKLTDSSVVYTESTFGCVYFRARRPVLINIKDVLNKKSP